MLFELCCATINYYYCIFLQVLKIIKVNLLVYDINDNSPQFQTETRGVVRVQILENASPGFSVDLPTAIDADSTMFGVQGYNLTVPGNVPQDTFTLRQRNGDVRLVLAQRLDREVKALYTLNVRHERGWRWRSSGAHVIFHVLLDNLCFNIELKKKKEC